MNTLFYPSSHFLFQTILVHFTLPLLRPTLTFLLSSTHHLRSAQLFSPFLSEALVNVLIKFIDDSLGSAFLSLPLPVLESTPLISQAPLGLNLMTPLSISLPPFPTHFTSLPFELHTQRQVVTAM
jgi:hypothetical protein